MAGGLEGKVAIVTGGNSGIGEATVQRFAQEGAKVAIVARRESEGMAVQQAVRDAGGDATFIRCDVTSTDDVEAMVARAVELYGDVLHVLVNNAGGGGGVAPDPFPEPGGDESWDYTLRLNLTSTYLVTRAAWPYLKAAGSASIVNISSLAAVAAYSEAMWDLLPGRSPSPAYFSAKAGMEAFTRLTASHGGPLGIRANVVRPGAILTPGASRFTPGHHALERLHEFIQMLPGTGDSEDIANAIYFLGSDQGKYITGQILAVDGGAVHKVS